jgi:hypothetical protein
MTYFEALYGSQYYEIIQKGRDGSKGRINGNIFFAAFIILLIIAAISLGNMLCPEFKTSLESTLKKVFGNNNGKTIGRLLTLPLFGLIYFFITKTVGSIKSYKQKVNAFMQYPDKIKKKANTKILIPFFITLGIVFAVVMFG